MEHTRKHMNVAVLAFGTIGDVLPVAVVVAKLATSEKNYAITFVTHSAHEFLERRLTSLGVRFHPVSTVPVSLPPEAACAQNLQGNLPGPVENQWKASLEKRHREECLSAVDQVFGQEEDGRQNLIIFNFFALEGWHLAELYNARCAVVAPYVVPYSAPASFERQFRSSRPFLYKRLQRAEPGEVGWGEVMHWMWPLFTERWTAWRTDTLHLSACPLTDPFTELPVSQCWPRAPPVMYGFSSGVVECPDYWPKTVHVCGFWYAPTEWEEDDLRNAVGPMLPGPYPPKLLEFLSENSRASNLPFFVGFSSIGSMGYLKNPEAFLKVILKVLEATDRRAILFTASYTALDAAIIASLKSSRTVEDHVVNCGQRDDVSRLKDGVLVGNNRLFCFSGSVPYRWLFPQLSVIIHHGGSGTTAAAIWSGIPQIICPFLLDQFYWAERMTWIGVAPNPLKPKILSPESDQEFLEAVNTLQSAIQDASSPTIRKGAALLSRKIRREDGIGNFVQTLRKELLF